MVFQNYAFYPHMTVAENMGFALAGHDPAHGEVDVIARTDLRDPLSTGETIHLRIRPGDEHVFSAETGERLPV